MDQLEFSRNADEHATSLHLHAMRFTKDEDEAKDLLQEGFVKVYQKLNSFDAKRGSFEGWMKRIFINLCIDHFRKQKLFSDVSIENISDDLASDDEDPMGVLHDISYDELMESVGKLPAGYRTVFNMYVVDEKSHKEIASELNISESTSKTQLFKARNMLQKNLLKMYTRVK